MSSSENFISPLMAKINSEETLTLEVLKKYIPVINKGEEAKESLANSVNLSRPEKQAFNKLIRNGDLAKENLMIICLPLVKGLAIKELKRRKTWGSRIKLDDLISEGYSGLLKGIKNYDINGNQKSPTNYLGQWITTEMRRNVEILDHDFSVPYETIERQRKIRAIRSRLQGELGREPTDEEIIEGSKDKSHTVNMMGRVNKVKNAPTAHRREITLKHVREERESYHRTGAVSAYAIQHDDSEFDVSETTSAVSITDGLGVESAESHVSSQTKTNVLSRIIDKTLASMNVGKVQQEVIKRKWGLSPFEEEESVRVIHVNTGVPRDRISKIVNIFSKDMITRGSIFHEIIDQLGQEELDSIDIGFIVDELGPYIPDPDYVVNVELTKDISGFDNVTNDFPYIQNTNINGFIGWFRCAQHGDFPAVFEEESFIPATISCPQCDRNIPRVFN